MTNHKRGLDSLIDVGIFTGRLKGKAAIVSLTDTRVELQAPSDGLLPSVNSDHICQHFMQLILPLNVIRIEET